MGDELSAEELETILGNESRQRLREAALNLLSYRMRSRFELRKRLLEKGFELPAVESLLAELEGKDLLNDREFARLFAREKVRQKCLGPVALKAELSPHHLDPDLVEAVQQEVYREFPPAELLGRLFKKRRVADRSRLDPKAKKRLRDFLLRKGYGWDAIREAFQAHDIS